MREPFPIVPLALLLAVGAAVGCGGDPDPGARLWRKRCSACHGADGAGRTRFAEGRPFADRTDGKWRHAPDRDSLRRLVAEGVPEGAMPPFAGTLTPAEIDAVVDHARKLAAAGRPAEGTP